MTITKPAVHQLLPVYGPGDAVGGAVRITRRLLHDMGLHSEVYADQVDPSLAGEAHPAADLAGAVAPGDIVMYHLSIGSPVAALFERCGARQVIVYHNLTPASYYERSSPQVAVWLRRGRRDLDRLAPRAELVIAMSDFNLADAYASGARTGVVIPPPVDLDRLSPSPSSPSTPPTMLFVGRYARNKCHDDLIRVLAAVRELVPECRLVLRGGENDTQVYVRALHRLARRLHVADAVDFGPAHVTDEEIARQYREASVFVCMSEHEGFCIPLLEAMAFNVPVVAFDAGAVPDTAGDAALLLGHKDPLVWAEAMARVINDTDLRATLIAAGRRRLLHFSERNIAVGLRTALVQLGVAVEVAA